MITPDTIVIGAGLAGVSAAHSLQSRGRDVLLIDARSGPALETSFANGGMLHPSMPDPWNGPGITGHLVRSIFDPHAAMKLRLSAIPGMAGWGLRFIKNSAPGPHWRATKANYHLADYSARHTGKLRDNLGLEYDSYDRGIIKVFAERDSLDHSLNLASKLANLGLSYDVLDAQGAVSLEPTLVDIEPHIAGAIYMPNDGAGDAFRFTAGLFEDFLTIGGQAKFNCSVSSLLTDGRQCRGVQTEQGEFIADSVVIAAGPRSHMLAKSAGIKLHIRPAKGYTLTVKIDDPAKLPKRPVLDESMHVAITPLGDSLRIGGTAEFAGFDYRLTPARIENLRRILRRTFPALVPHLDLDEAAAWCGLRPMTADGMPYVGETDVKGLWVSSGHGQLGWSMASGSGELLADLMTGGQPAIDPHPYRITR